MAGTALKSHRWILENRLSPPPGLFVLPMDEEKKSRKV
jgi:hypothetical protein